MSATSCEETGDNKGFVVVICSGHRVSDLAGVVGFVGFGAVLFMGPGAANFLIFERALV
jgi:hypothetical protein